MVGGLNPLADARDVAAGVSNIWQGKAGGWFGFGSSLLGCIPVVGDAGKVVLKGRRKVATEVAQVGIARVAKETTQQAAKEAAQRAKNAFPADPNDFTKQLGVPPVKVARTPDGTTRMVWEPNANTRIRFESHPESLSPGNPRHHGEHYHVELKPDGVTWGQAQRRGVITKSYPSGYSPGMGTGFLPGESFPGN